jgi:hypothetical protein
MVLAMPSKPQTPPDDSIDAELDGLLAVWNRDYAPAQRKERELTPFEIERERRMKNAPPLSAAAIRQMELAEASEPHVRTSSVSRRPDLEAAAEVQMSRREPPRPKRAQKPPPQSKSVAPEITKLRVMQRAAKADLALAQAVSREARVRARVGTRTILPVEDRAKLRHEARENRQEARRNGAAPQSPGDTVVSLSQPVRPDNGVSSTETLAELEARCKAKGLIV